MKVMNKKYISGAIDLALEMLSIENIDNDMVDSIAKTVGYEFRLGVDNKKDTLVSALSVLSVENSKNSELDRISNIVYELAVKSRNAYLKTIKPIPELNLSAKDIEKMSIINKIDKKQYKLFKKYDIINYHYISINIGDYEPNKPLNNTGSLDEMQNKYNKLYDQTINSSIINGVIEYFEEDNDVSDEYIIIPEYKPYRYNDNGDLAYDSMITEK